MVYGVWNGGHGYCNGDPTEDMEEFRNLAHAKDVLRSREDNSGVYPQDVFYVRRDRDAVRMPGVEGSSMQLYPDADSVEPYARLVFGPRGGVRVENF